MIFLCTCVLHAYETLPLLDGWTFHPGNSGTNPPELSGVGPRETIRIPHDWSIHHSTNPDESSEAGGGYFPTGTAWYTREIEVPMSWQDQRVYVHFEGIYRSAQIWINGIHVGERANGYLPVRAELSPHLECGKTNILAVRVDNSRQPNSRWYSGSGIYRPAWLEVRHPVHLLPDSIRIQTSALYPDAATIGMEATALNGTTGTLSIRTEFILISPNGIPLQTQFEKRKLAPGETGHFKRQLPIPNPELWSPDSPTLYRAVIKTYTDGLLTDREELEIGIRRVEVNAIEGLLLNGEPLLLIGCNVHHDNGILGATVYPETEERKVHLLKEAGFNAVRTSHNPPSKAFLEACDRLGMMVIDEAFDGWKVVKMPRDYGLDFDDNWEEDLRDFICRDRNHPSVIMWSIGNEMYERGKESAIEIAGKMRTVIRQLDTTRPVTAGVNGLGGTGQWSDLDKLFSILDVVGYNYELEEQHGPDHTRLPDRVMYSSESYVTDVFANWKIASEQNHVLGDFVWSGLDYLGEAGIGRVYPPGEEAIDHWEADHYPWHGATCGDIDLIGHRKPISHYRNIVWDRGETLYMSVMQPSLDNEPWSLTRWATPPLRESWTWPGHEGESMRVEVYSRHKTVRLFLDRTLIGEQSISEANEFKAVFSVPYAAGTLRAQGILPEHGLHDASVVEEFSLTTAGSPRMIRMNANRSTVSPNGQDLVFIDVTITDAGGRRCPDATLPVTYIIEGPGEILATGSADLASTEAYGSNPRKTYQGRSLLVVRCLDEPGDILIRAQSGGLIEGTVSIQSAWPL